MQKIALLLISTISISLAVASPSDHLREAKIKYPYSLIGDDFGVLNEDDLAANTCDAIPEPFSYKSMASIYWKCFETKHVSFICDRGDGIPDPHEGLLAFMVLKVSKKDNDNEYLARHAFSLKECKSFEREFAKLTRSERHVCIAGSSPSLDIDKKGIPLSYWIFEKYKTRKGCDSFFDQCNLKKMIKEGCTLHPIELKGS